MPFKMWVNDFMLAARASEIEAEKAARGLEDFMEYHNSHLDMRLDLSGVALSQLRSLKTVMDNRLRIARAHVKEAAMAFKCPYTVWYIDQGSAMPDFYPGWYVSHVPPANCKGYSHLLQLKHYGPFDDPAVANYEGFYRFFETSFVKAMRDFVVVPSYVMVPNGLTPSTETFSSEGEAVIAAVADNRRDKIPYVVYRLKPDDTHMVGPVYTFDYIGRKLTAQEGV